MPRHTPLGWSAEKIKVLGTLAKSESGRSVVRSPVFQPQMDNDGRPFCGIVVHGRSSAVSQLFRPVGKANGPRSTGRPGEPEQNMVPPDLPTAHTNRAGHGVLELERTVCERLGRPRLPPRGWRRKMVESLAGRTLKHATIDALTGQPL